MTAVFIVHHSGYGHTKKLAEAVLEGMQQCSMGGPMAQSPSASTVAEGPPRGDLATGRLFGKRVAEAALKLTGTALPAA